nr:ARMT1-like domain-containing protein [Candidatus Sigynarchaeota archaeon]
MKFHANCIPCLLNQTIRVINIKDKGTSRKDTKALLNRVMDILKDDAIMDAVPSRTGQRVYKAIGEFFHDPDIFKEIKWRSNEIAAKMYPSLVEKVRASSDPLKTAVSIAIVGNLIDFGTNIEYDLEKEIDDLHLAIDHFNALHGALKRAKSILYIADNAGELIFDKVLIEEILRQFDTEVIYSVRAGPIINDATLEDASLASIDKLVKVIEGTQSPGIILDEASPEFKRVYSTADVIIAKGQGNFEALSERPKSENIFFMLKAKCNIMEDYFHVPMGSSILAHWKRL